MKTIEQFIDDFRMSQNTYIEHGEEALRHTFRAGYCYYFAKILEDAFPGGEICQAYPYGHIVYVYDGIPYDINGICDYDVSDEDFIPISKIDINDFKHNEKEEIK